VPRRLLPIALAACCVLALAASCGTSDGGSATARATSNERPTSTAPTTTATSGVDPLTGFPSDWRPAPLNWTSCDVATRAQCATLTVPRDWGDPTGPTIDLALARIPATGDRIGSVVVNPGGPGGSGLDFLAQNPVDTAVSRRFDVVSWDPRGVGKSTRLTCGADTVPPFLAADPDPDTPEEEATLEQRADAVAKDCAATDAALLPHLGTVDVARDLEAIRRALGDEPLNYVGYSYGTQIGQQYAHYFPKNIRSMVLDGVVDPSLGFTEFLKEQIAGFNASFDANVAGCRKAGPSTCGVDDLAAAYDKVQAQVEQAPLKTDSGDPVGPAELEVAATYVAYGSDGWKELGPALAKAVNDKDGTDLLELAQGYYDFGGYAAYAAVVCTDTPPPADPVAWKAFADEARRLSPRFGGSVANELLPCATWPTRSSAVPTALTAPGAPPILVVGNTGDPATPYGNAVAVAGRLGSGVLVTADIDGHTAYGVDRCVTRTVDRYLIDLTVPPSGTRCS
jgi:pimeloyl-ACP methyl ester carboxylesterase